MKTFEKIYNALKDYCNNKSNTRWTVDNIKFYKDETDCVDISCSFDIFPRYNQEPLGSCNIFIINKEPFVDSLTVVFNPYKENADGIGNVRPSIVLPPTRYAQAGEFLGRYFYLLLDELYYMTSFQAARIKFFLQMVK